MSNVNLDRMGVSDAIDCLALHMPQAIPSMLTDTANKVSQCPVARNMAHAVLGAAEGATGLACATASTVTFFMSYSVMNDLYNLAVANGRYEDCLLFNPNSESYGAKPPGINFSYYAKWVTIPAATSLAFYKINRVVTDLNQSF